MNKMKTKYLDFLKINENNNNNNNNNVITLSEIEKVFKEVFDDSKVSSVKSLYEYDKEKKENKLVISINNLFYEETNIIYTKFVFVVDDKKEKLQNNMLYYLYDINCNFKKVIFNDTDELKIELYKILDGKIIGKDLKKISDMSVHLTSTTNEWLSNNNIDSVSIYNINYKPLIDNISCDSLFFRFEINIEDSTYIELNIRKIDNNEFKLSFSKGDWFHHITLTDINGTPQAIGETIKKYII